MVKELNIEQADSKDGTLEKEFIKFKEKMQSMFKGLDGSLCQEISEMEKKFI